MDSLFKGGDGGDFGEDLGGDLGLHVPQRAETTAMVAAIHAARKERSRAWWIKGWGSNGKGGNLLPMITIREKNFLAKVFLLG